VLVGAQATGTKTCGTNVAPVEIHGLTLIKLSEAHTSQEGFY